MTTTIALDFLGCKLNQAEVQELAGQLAAAGYQVVPAGEPADIYVLNTCTVTREADRKARQMLRAARRRNPAVRLAAIGCYAQRAPEELSGIEGVELVLGNDCKRSLPELLGEAPRGTHNTAPAAGRTRAFIRVQDGCKTFCAYCIVPYVRSELISVPAERVLGMVRERAAQGVREIVLTGTEVGTYDDGGLDLAGLLQRILRETDIERLRLSSLQPAEVTPGLLVLWQDPRLCPHFHLSLQSGSDAVLKRMRRRYTTQQYAAALQRLWNSVPDVAVTTDIIVGFPGETDGEFEESYEFCRQAGFARIHVFPYSARPGTAAAGLPGQVAEPVKKERGRRMLALGKEASRAFCERFTGRTLDVLFEQETQGLWTGLTGNYLKVYATAAGAMENEIKPVRLAKPYRDGMKGAALPV